MARSALVAELEGAQAELLAHRRSGGAAGGRSEGSSPPPRPPTPSRRSTTRARRRAQAVLVSRAARTVSLFDFAALLGRRLFPLKVRSQASLLTLLALGRSALRVCSKSSARTVELHRIKGYLSRLTALYLSVAHDSASLAGWQSGAMRSRYLRSARAHVVGWVSTSSGFGGVEEERKRSTHRRRPPSSARAWRALSRGGTAP